MTRICERFSQYNTIITDDDCESYVVCKLRCNLIRWRSVPLIVNCIVMQDFLSESRVHERLTDFEKIFSTFLNTPKIITVCLSISFQI